MNNDLLGVFLEQELNNSVRELLAVAVEESKSSGGRSLKGALSLTVSMLSWTLSVAQ